MQTLTKPRRKTRRRLTQEERDDRNNEALSNGTRFVPNSNDGPVTLEFKARGIPVEDIHTFAPDQNVFTYNAWQAQGRQVRKGETSVRCTVWIPVVVKSKDPDKPDKTRSRMHNACLFHISQTDEIDGVS